MEFGFKGFPYCYFTSYNIFYFPFHYYYFVGHDEMVEALLIKY